MAILVIANAAPVLAGSSNAELDFRKAIIANIALKNACKQFVGGGAVHVAIDSAKKDFLLLGMSVGEVDSSITGIETEIAKAKQIQMKWLCVRLTGNLDRNLEDKRASYLQSK